MVLYVQWGNDKRTISTAQNIITDVRVQPFSDERNEQIHFTF